MDDELYHYGVKGMKWGVRRYQNPDGTFTTAGRKRYRELVTPEGNYTQKALDKGFDRKVEKGVKNYILGRRIRDPFVAEVIRENKDQIDMLIEEAKNRRITEINAEQNRLADEQTRMMAEQSSQMGADYARREAERASRQAASLGMTGGMNPFMFG